MNTPSTHKGIRIYNDPNLPRSIRPHKQIFNVKQGLERDHELDRAFSLYHREENKWGMRMREIKVIKKAYGVSRSQAEKISILAEKEQISYDQAFDLYTKDAPISTNGLGVKGIPVFKQIDKS